MHLNSIIVLGFVLVYQLNGENLENARNGQFPSLVALLDLKMNYVGPACLITTYHVFSAARWHVPGKALMALAGDISLSRTVRDTRQLRSIAKITVHPDYEDAKDPNFDVAVCLVSKPFKLLPSVQPSITCGHPPDVGEYCLSVGWGVINESSMGMPNSFAVSNVSDTLLPSTTASNPVSKPSNVLLYQEFEVAPKMACKKSLRANGICGRAYDTEKLAIEYGGPVMCSQKLCGIFINNPRLGPATVSFNIMKYFLDWVEEEITLESQAVSNQHYIKRSHAEKKDCFSFWIRCVEILKLLIYFI